MQNRLADQLRPQFQRHPRVVGMVLIIIGAATFWWSAYRPYLNALTHQQIRLYQVGILPSLLCPFLVLFGIAMLLFGPAMIRRNASASSTAATPGVKVLTTVAVFAAWAVLSAPFCAIMGRIEALGYDVGSNPVYYVSRHTPPLHWLAEMTDRLIP